MPGTDYRARARMRLAAHKRAGTQSYKPFSRRTGNLKKTTAKGAYKPNRKSNFQKRRAPFVETKSVDDILIAGKAGVLNAGEESDTIRNPVHSLEISNGTAGAPNTFTMLPLNSFNNMQRGLSHSDIIGDNIYSRYLKAKVEIQLPGNDKIIRHACDLYLIHGFVTLPLGLNFNTTPEANDLTRTQLNAHISNQLLQYFNQRSDKLQFMTKRQNNIKILGYRKVKPNNNQALGGSSGPIVNNPSVGGAIITGAGTPPLVNMTCNFPTKRKIFYEDGKSNLAAPVNNFGMMYANFAWQPFMCLYNPTADSFTDASLYPVGEPKFKVRYNSKHYFSDS